MRPGQRMASKVKKRRAWNSEREQERFEKDCLESGHSCMRGHEGHVQVCTWRKIRKKAAAKQRSECCEAKQRVLRRVSVREGADCATRRCSNVCEDREGEVFKRQRRIGERRRDAKEGAQSESREERERRRGSRE
eukprot:908523-Pleurochrysis_carterae.AAC.1